MNKKISLAFIPLLLSCSVHDATQDLTQYVDPFIGTAYVGHTHPAAQLPFGMVQLGPDTGIDSWEHCSGYCDTDSSIIGFSHTHLSGTGCPDMGDIMFMPVVGDVALTAGSAEDTSTGYRSKFSHDSEQASSGYYKVFLDDYKVQVELTTTLRTGYHRYTFPQSAKSGLVIDLGHGIGDEPIETSIAMLNDSVVVGKRRSKGFAEDHCFYFYAVLSKPVSGIKTYADNRLLTTTEAHGKVVKMALSFETAEKEELTVKAALSTTGIEGAKLNLETEIGNLGFDAIASQAKNVWNRYLNQIQVTPIEEGQKVSFYTALYHTLIVPNLVNDIDGRYGLTDTIIGNQATDQYTNFSLWDTYRATHPFYILMCPDKNNDFITSILAYYHRNGILCTNEYAQNETWCMIGNHAVTVLADAYLKGMLPERKKEMSQAIYKSLTISHPKSDWELYDKYGYYPFDLLSVESASRTLEHCYDDYCASMVALQEKDSAQWRFFSKRADNFENLFDDSTKLIRPKDSKGNWQYPFDPFLLCHAGTSGGDYTEANAWQYTWHIQHNIPALIKLMGGKETFENKLDSLFSLDTQSLGGGFHGDVTGMMGQYAHGNEPSHHVAYLYNYTDHPYKGQRIIRDIFDRFYKPYRDGLSGNDDCGQMSAWYMFSAMGFYPVDPISGQYLFGAPQFKEVKLNLPNGNQFKIIAHNISAENKYIHSIKLNGEKVTLPYIHYNDIVKGGTLEFEMTSSYGDSFYN